MEGDPGMHRPYAGPWAVRGTGRTRLCTVRLRGLAPLMGHGRPRLWDRGEAPSMGQGGLVNGTELRGLVCEGWIVL